MNTIKSWLINHKSELIRIGYYSIGFIFGGIICTKINDFCIANGWRIWHENGLVKFFSPEGIEVSAEEFSKLMK